MLTFRATSIRRITACGLIRPTTLTPHYDPSYFRATSKHYTNLDKARRIPLTDLSPDALKEIANGL